METLNVKIDSRVKRELKDFANEIGVPVSSLVNGTIRQMLRERRVVFSTALEPTASFATDLKRIEGDVKAGRNVSKAYSSIDDMFGDLDAEK